MHNEPLPENKVFSEIVKELFGDIIQYETDVPQDFKRPCFLFINPDKNTSTKELTKAMYKLTKNYEIYHFCTEDDVDSLETNKSLLIDYLRGVKKIQIPDTERYLTIEDVAADTDDVNSMVAFMIKVSMVKTRNLRRPVVNKISQVVNKLMIDKEDV